MPRSPVDLESLEPRRVCLIKPSSLGDIVHALPVLSALRARWPESHIAWVVNKGLRSLVDGHPMLDVVIPFDRASARLSPGGLLSIGRFFRMLRQERFDVVIDLQGLLRSGLMAAASGAPVRVGLAAAREGATRFYTHRIEVPPEKTHAVDKLLAVAAAFGAEISDARVVLSLNENHQQRARELLAGIPRPRLILNTGARWLTKRWPPEHFAAIARRAAREFGAGLVAVGASEDAPLIEALRRELSPHPLLDLGGKTSLPELAALAAEADLFLSNDTGPLHLAAATGTTVIGIYTCTRPEWTGPYGPNALALSSTVWCAGSCVKTCDRLECMRELTPDRVWPAVAQALAVPGGSRRRHPAA